MQTGFASAEKTHLLSKLLITLKVTVISSMEPRMLHVSFS